MNQRYWPEEKQRKEDIHGYWHMQDLKYQSVLEGLSDLDNENISEMREALKAFIKKNTDDSLSFKKKFMEYLKEQYLEILEVYIEYDDWTALGEYVYGKAWAQLFLEDNDTSLTFLPIHSYISSQAFFDEVQPHYPQIKEHIVQKVENLIDVSNKNPNDWHISGSDSRFIVSAIHRWRKHKDINKLYSRWFENLLMGNYYGKEQVFFEILLQSDPSQFIKMLNRYKSIYQIYGTLYHAGVFGCYETWKKLLPLAPKAFDDVNLSWLNNQYILPLLLSVIPEKLIFVKDQEYANNIFDDILEMISKRNDAEVIHLQIFSLLWEKMIRFKNRGLEDGFSHDIDLINHLLNHEKIQSWSLEKYHLKKNNKQYFSLLAAFASTENPSQKIWDKLISVIPNKIKKIEKLKAIDFSSNLFTDNGSHIINFGCYSFGSYLLKLDNPLEEWEKFIDKSRVLREYLYQPPFDMDVGFNANDIIQTYYMVGMAILDYAIDMQDNQHSNIINPLYTKLYQEAKIWKRQQNPLDAFWGNMIAHLLIRRLVFTFSDSYPQRVKEETYPKVSQILNENIGLNEQYFSLIFELKKYIGIEAIQKEFLVHQSQFKKIYKDAKYFDQYQRQERNLIAEGYQDFFEKLVDLQ